MSRSENPVKLKMALSELKKQLKSAHDLISRLSQHKGNGGLRLFDRQGNSGISEILKGIENANRSCGQVESALGRGGLSNLNTPDI